VGLVPSRWFGVSFWGLSQGEARRNCSGGEDAAYPHQDEKTPEPLL
jgi:hypothetical protein